MPYKLTREDFEKIAGEEMRRIPRRFRRLLKNITVIVEDYPDDHVLRETGFRRNEIMGLFRGEPYGHKESFFSIPSPYPDAIYLYRRNIEAVSNSEEELREEIRMTVLHEVGHYFGMSEDDLRELEDPE